jgi:O-antigen/teichoic acid export membrane protein
LAFFATSLAQRGIGIVCQFVQVPIALHYLGSEAFGLWVTLITLNFILVSTDFGIGLGVQNKITEALGVGDSDRARNVFVTGLCFLLGIMIVLLGFIIPFCLFSDISQLLRITDPRLTVSASPSLLWVAVIWCVNIPLGLGQRLAFASQVGWMSNIASSVSQLLTLAIVSTAAWFELGVTTFFVLSFASGALISFVFLLYLLRHLSWLDLRLAEFQSPILGDISRLGILFFIQQLAALVMFSSPSLILSVTLGAAAVTSYSLVQRVLSLFMIAVTALLLPLWPAYADAKAKSDWPWIRRTMVRSFLLVCGLGIVPMVAVGPFVQTLISWWTGGAAVTPPQSLVWLLLAWNALLVLQQPFGFLLVGLSEIKRATVYSLLSAAASLAMILLLIPKFGVNAVPIGLIIGFVPFIMVGTCFESVDLLFSPRRQRSALSRTEPVPSV